MSSAVGFITGVPKMLLRLEGLSILFAGTMGYFTLGGSWWLFIIVMIVPDLFLLGFLGGNKLGAILYNAAHWYALPLTAIVWGFIKAEPIISEIGLAWAAHIGLDRAFCNGLKYAEGYGFTHLGRPSYAS